MWSLCLPSSAPQSPTSLQAVSFFMTVNIVLYFVNNKIMMSNLTSTFLLFTRGNFVFCWYNKGRPFPNHGPLHKVAGRHQLSHHCPLVAARGTSRRWAERKHPQQARGGLRLNAPPSPATPLPCPQPPSAHWTRGTLPLSPEPDLTTKCLSSQALRKKVKRCNEPGSLGSPTTGHMAACVCVCWVGGCQDSPLGFIVLIQKQGY